MRIGERLRSLRIGLESPVQSVEHPVSRQAIDSSEGFVAQFERILGGQELLTHWGNTLLVCRGYPLEVEHGQRCLSEALRIPSTSLARLGRDPTLSGIDPSGIAFLDCETTGLAGGTGTHVFLVGVARICGEEVQIRQFFMPDYADERAMLAAVDEHLARFEALASFNGKCFDLPLLETRFTLARLQPDWLRLPHLDLMHPSRRLWRRRLASCALTSLERGVLGFQRQGDVAGWAIPGIYFDYLITRDLTCLAPVFEHNRLDLLSLVALLGEMATALEGSRELEHALDYYSLGTLLEDFGEDEASAICYERALAGDLCQAERGEVQVRLSLLYKRLRLSESALGVWGEIARARGTRSIFALVEMAKYAEHRQHDYRAALDLTQQAIRTHALSKLPRDARWLAHSESLQHRLQRLQRRLRRQG